MIFCERLQLFGIMLRKMATRRGFDPLSPVRQTGRLARCVTGRVGLRCWCALLVCLGRFERPLNAFSGQRLFQLGYRHMHIDWRTGPATIRDLTVEETAALPIKLLVRDAP